MRFMKHSRGKNAWKIVIFLVINKEEKRTILKVKRQENSFKTILHNQILVFFKIYLSQKKSERKILFFLSNYLTSYVRYTYKFIFE
ncbi:hypothetical protein BpHYR1_038752 [Brachionus plicatilis]|uniref:Uncharacterized protein n=1 Tax=Brachionus plicatilis TaxID=10195 RepID=A0A3M7QZW8_BRAPC|nr:hypothetical protein BpHYR1_038752 [Brachionus plicatilis]